MTSKPKPLYAARDPRICPVCGHASYSVGGVHPQCAVRQADARRLEAEKQEAVRAEAVNGPQRRKPLHRFCPKCHAQVHVRHQKCECGYMFGIQNRGGT
jgi:hypothetical protein